MGATIAVVRTDRALRFALGRTGTAAFDESAAAYTRATVLIVATDRPVRQTGAIVVVSIDQPVAVVVEAVIA
jgi:hypothetical protein